MAAWRHQGGGGGGVPPPVSGLDGAAAAVAAAVDVLTLTTAGGRSGVDWSAAAGVAATPGAAAVADRGGGGGCGDAALAAAGSLDALGRHLRAVALPLVNAAAAAAARRALTNAADAVAHCCRARVARPPCAIDRPRRCGGSGSSGGGSVSATHQNGGRAAPPTDAALVGAFGSTADDAATLNALPSTVAVCSAAVRRLFTVASSPLPVTSVAANMRLWAVVSAAATASRERLGRGAGVAATFALLARHRRVAEVAENFRLTLDVVRLRARGYAHLLGALPTVGRAAAAAAASAAAAGRGGGGARSAEAVHEAIVGLPYKQPPPTSTWSLRRRPPRGGAGGGLPRRARRAVGGRRRRRRRAHRRRALWRRCRCRWRLARRPPPAPQRAAARRPVGARRAARTSNGCGGRAGRGRAPNLVGPVLTVVSDGIFADGPSPRVVADAAALVADAASLTGADFPLAAPILAAAEPVAAVLPAVGPHGEALGVWRAANRRWARATRTLAASIPVSWGGAGGRGGGVLAESSALVDIGVGGSWREAAPH
ncbi:hypothetical protein BU14_0271s0011 [Porphyra umbilicalis]|uniref:Uncharacterized protein n=1 Tax=Porphyra umbilicalis TaxID=2786 RepID=A0A1X6P1S0_PORUM|nr:hypothetical protein BU14_0271s0011 [Porphyra umbilicalis]|eukprot:OSX74716.1 hypothetical protein BU14_0271s0011 [Porphyra umbilicalis]